MRFFLRGVKEPMKNYDISLTHQRAKEKLQHFPRTPKSQRKMTTFPSHTKEPKKNDDISLAHQRAKEKRRHFHFLVDIYSMGRGREPGEYLT